MMMTDSLNEPRHVSRGVGLGAGGTIKSLISDIRRISNDGVHHGQLREQFGGRIKVKEVRHPQIDDAGRVQYAGNRLSRRSDCTRVDVGPVKLCCTLGAFR
jgi:hypothetical protein